MLTNDPLRLLLAAALLAAFILICLAPLLRVRRQRRAAREAAAAAATSRACLVVHASQSGSAEALAAQTAATLQLAGMPVRLCALAELDAAQLHQAERVLFVASTSGEGDPPDAAVPFVSRVMGGELDLPQLHYAVLALGNRHYRHFCGFGRALDAWLQQQGAQPLFPRIEVDRGDAAAITAWRHQLSTLAGTSDAPDWEAPPFAPWRLAARVLLNPDSAGAPLYHLELEPRDGPLPQWQSGDLAQVAAPADGDHPRTYSIASIPADGRLHLLVRLHAHGDGSYGLASGWLALQAAVGQTVQLRLRPHRRFRLEQNSERPLILIGNGSGMAGLRGHLKARAQAGQHRNWLLFGERHAAHDFHYRAELEAWQRAGVLPRLDMVFSRDQPQRLYVQDRLLGNADELAAWVEQGAAIYVCGSLEGMAAGVDQALEQLLGPVRLSALTADGRYRRDVY